jgi:hypothetical protein
MSIYILSNVYTAIWMLVYLYHPEHHNYIDHINLRGHRLCSILPYLLKYNSPVLLSGLCCNRIVVFMKSLNIKHLKSIFKYFNIFYRIPQIRILNPDLIFLKCKR